MKIEFPIALSDIEIMVTRNTYMNPYHNFDLKIRGDGTVSLNPYGYSQITPVQFSIDPEVVKDLLAEAMETGFFEMKSDYSEESCLIITPEGTIKQELGMMLDGEAKDITIKIGNRKKSVHAYYGYPKRLEWFYQLILNTAAVSERLEDWIDE